MRNSNQGPGIILKLADEIDVSCAMLAKALLTKYYELYDNSGTKLACLKRHLKDSTLIEEPDIAYEVFLVCSISIF